MIRPLHSSPIIIKKVIIFSFYNCHTFSHLLSFSLQLPQKIPKVISWCIQPNPLRLKGFVKSLILKKTNKCKCMNCFKSNNSFKSSNSFKRKKLPPRVVKEIQNHWRIYHNQCILSWLRWVRQDTNKLLRGLLQILSIKVNNSIKRKMEKPWREGSVML